MSRRHQVHASLVAAIVGLVAAKAQPPAILLDTGTHCRRYLRRADPRRREEADPGRVGQRQGDLPGGTLRRDRAGLQDHDAVRQALGLLHVMGGQEHRLARTAKPFDQHPHAPARRRVKPRGRLVEKQHVRIAGQADGHVHPAPLTARQAPDALACFVRQPGGRNRRVQIGRPPEVPREHRDRFPDRIDGVELRVVEHQPDTVAPVPRCARRISAEY
jgi:hypothetical protein